jgi:DNA-damage-inducible protein J
MATIQVRTDDNLKKKAQDVLKEIGLDLSSAINVYLRQIVLTGSIPFQIRTVNGFTPEQEEQMIRETEEALRSGKSYDSAEELHTDILGPDYANG